MPRAKMPRCTYKEGSRRCPMDGSGDPPLCAPHRVALAEASRPKPPARVLLDSLSDWLQGNPINRDATLGAAEAFLSQWVAGIGGNYRPDIAGISEDAAHRRAQSGTERPWNWNIPHSGQRQQPPPHDPDAELRRARAAARQVLGFAPGELLDGDRIKAHHRRLVKKHHPDHGGSTKKMAMINLARDVLMAELVES
jgi:hypothetical protein